MQLYRKILLMALKLAGADIGYQISKHLLENSPNIPLLLSLYQTVVFIKHSTP